VTGAGSDIGRGVALALGAAGADVVVNYLRADDQADNVNGASLFIDGGMTLYPGFATGG
jgi:NAD(P)-dependent dehydrogenase (short-subunit alcohol dehydrogenase family)